MYTKYLRCHWKDFKQKTLSMTVKMDNTTIRERILLHLSRFKMVNEEEVYNLPFDLTQDGIAAALGISRAHSSLELKKLREAGKVRENQVHVIGSGIRRKVYYLEPDGKTEADHIRKKLEDAGVPFETVLDMRKCDPGLMWDKLSPSDRDALGLACVIRIPVNKKLLPPTDSGVIPATHEGIVNISTETKKRYLDAVDAESVRRWNSAAADWWMDNVSDDQERLYHLSAAGRSAEANRLLINKSASFIENHNDDLLEIIKGMEVPAKDKLASWSIRSMIAVACRDADFAERAASELDGLGSDDGEIIRGESKLIRKDPGSSLEIAEKVYSESGTARSAMLVCRSLYAMGRYDDAEKAIVDVMKKFAETGDISRLDEMMVLRAGIAYGRGNSQDCLSYLGKALASCRNEARRESIVTLTETVRSGRRAAIFD